jgi:hypothetical protein
MSYERPPFYSPNRGPAPPRQPKPGEEIWRLRQGEHVQTCELRNDSKAGAGWDVMVLENGEPLFRDAARMSTAGSAADRMGGSDGRP